MRSPACENCPLHGQKKLTRVHGFFPSTFNGLAIIVDQPSLADIRANPPALLQSRPGKLVRSMLKHAGLKPEECLVLPAISCYGGKDWPKGTAGKQQEIQAHQACRQLLLSTLETWRPGVILAMGKSALQSLLNNPKAKVSKLRGTTIDYELDTGHRCWLTATEAPSTTLGGFGYSADVVAADFRKVGRWLSQGVEPWIENLAVAPKANELRAMSVHWRGLPIGIDVETIPVPKNRWLCPLRSIGIGGYYGAASIPLMNGDWEQYYTQTEYLEVRQVLRELLADESQPKVFHHKQFDIPVLISHGFDVKGLTHCTMVAHHVLHPRGVLHNLQYAAAHYLDVPAWKTDFEEDWNAPFKDLAIYNCRDVMVTVRLFVALNSAIQSRALQIAYDLELYNAEIAWKMSEVGITLDHGLRHRRITDFEQRSQELKAYIRTESGVDAAHKSLFELWDEAPYRAHWDTKIKDIVAGARPDIQLLLNDLERVAFVSLTKTDKKRLRESADKLREYKLDWSYDFENKDEKKLASKCAQVFRSSIDRLHEAIHRSPFLELSNDGQMGVLIHDWLLLPAAELPDSKGNYQTNERALYHLQKHPIVGAWQEWKSCQHKLTWLRNLPVFPDDKIHHAYKSTTTPSVRYAGGTNKAGADPFEKFNPQNPEKDMLDLFIAPPGYVYVGGDISGAEIRGAAAISGDRNMARQIRDFDEGRTLFDAHATRAIRLWPEYPKLEKKEQDLLRYIAKRANFLIIYGGGKGTLAKVWKERLDPEDSLDAQRAKNLQLEDQCAKIIKDVHSDWFVLSAFLEEGFQQALRTGWLKAGHVTNHWLRFPIHDEDHVSRAFCYNLPVQRTARELVVTMSRNVNRRLPGDCLQVADLHDQIFVIAPIRKAELVRKIMVEEMNITWNGIDFKTDVLIGKTWKDVK